MKFKKSFARSNGLVTALFKTIPSSCTAMSCLSKCEPGEDRSRVGWKTKREVEDRDGRIYLSGMIS